MESQLSEEARWASGLAARLRLIQANFADDPSNVRQGYLVEEIERSLKSVTPTRKKAHLDCLVERFPSWEGVRTAAASDARAGAVPVTPDALVTRLVEIAPTLSGDARAAFAKQLQAVGLVIKESPDSFVDLPPELQKKLGLAPGKPLQMERAVKLLAITADLTLALDQLVWALWRQLAPKSLIKKEVEFNRLAGSYLAGDAEVSTTQLAQPIEKTRKMVTALLNAVGLAGKYYAKEYTRHMSPEAIKDVAEMEKRTLETLDAATGRVFVRTAKERATEDGIQHELQEAVVKAATEIYQGARART
jgi:hypothetical protein